MVSRLISGCGAALLVFLTAACGSTSVTQSTAPDPVRCQSSLATVPTIPAAGGRVDVSVVTNRECSWTASSNTSWIQVSPTSGQGEASITLTASANPQGIARNGNISLNGSQVAISQAPSPCTYSLNPTDVTMPAEGGTTATRVQTLVGCNWSASSPAGWAVVQTASGSGPTNVGVGLDPNDGVAARSVNVVIAGRNFTITQSGKPATTSPPTTPTTPTPTPPPPTPPPGPNPPPQQCSYAIDPVTRVVRDKGGDQTVKVTASSGCTWTASSNASWIAIKGAGQGTGNGDVKYEVERNRSPLGRIGTLTIAGYSHIVLQEPGE